MLFIGDIHITSKHSDAILGQIRELTVLHAHEQHIIFLGDFVYHFIYDRKALLQLFSLLIEFAKQGKVLYLLAGNHDRIAGHFVFEEARQSLLFMGSTQIHFITRPRHTTIEGVACLFFPFYHPEEQTITNDLFPELREETHPQRKKSWYINNILATEIAHRKSHATTDRLLLIHHRYIAKTKFPGQQSLFGYDSPALSPIFLDDPVLRMISGHLHEPFCYQQYLCTGSMWHSSPLEINQQKFVYTLDPEKRQITARPLWYNPYLQIAYPNVPLSKEEITKQIQINFDRIEKQLQSGHREVVAKGVVATNLTRTTITLTTTDLSMQDLPQAFQSELLKEIGTIKHKLIQHTDLSLVHELDRASLDLTNRFSDRKVLLRRFLEQKYGTHGDRYIHLLEEEKIL